MSIVSSKYGRSPSESPPLTIAPFSGFRFLVTAIGLYLIGSCSGDVIDEASMSGTFGARPNSLCMRSRQVLRVSNGNWSGLLDNLHN